ncbi:MAG TPA: Lrp/AsnC family transcriptional regulator [Steroidobacteraceae bacterium]|jgi:Lrp/AsnC family leucine-responsive transcriptional regulator
MAQARKSVNLKENSGNLLQIAPLLRDARNVQILALLENDPRISVSELARRVGMSAPATRERIQRMEEAGVIQGCRLEIDHAALGYPIVAFIRVRPMPGKLPKIAELAVSLPQVMECHRITGEDCFILKVGLDSLDNLDVILDQFLVYGQTTTSIVQSTPVAPRHLPLPGKK